MWLYVTRFCIENNEILYWHVLYGKFTVLYSFIDTLVADDKELVEDILVKVEEGVRQVC